MDKIHTDVLIIGAGAAGIRAALAASQAGADVIMATNGPVAETGSTFSEVTNGWGIQALVGNERTHDNLECFYNDIIRVGLGTCETGLVRVLVEESGPRLEDLISYGIRFKRDNKGEHARVKGCFSRYERAFITENHRNIKQTFTRLLKSSKITILQGRALELITEARSCWGAWIAIEPEEVLQVNSKSTIIATGGAAGLFLDNLAGRAEMGDGYALAFRAWAKLANFEFIQFMLGLKKNGTRYFLPAAELETPGALQNSDGEDILQKQIPNAEIRRQALSDRFTHAPFSCRDNSYRIDKALARERGKGRKVYFKPNASGPIAEAVHFAHAFNGGVVINEFAESTVSGLYAAGEAAAGPHGADRIGGCMMTATQVFGERAGRFAALRAKKISTSPDTIRTPRSVKKMGHHSTSNPLKGKLLSIEKGIREIYSRNMGIIRHKEGLNKCLQEIEAADSYLEKIGEVNRVDRLNFKNMLQVMRLTIQSALNRRKSLGSHFRIDATP